jgi:hypothetical protein
VVSPPGRGGCQCGSFRHAMQPHLGILNVDPDRVEVDAAIPSVLPVDPDEDAAHGTVIGAIIGASMWAGIFASWHIM